MEDRKPASTYIKFYVFFERLSGFKNVNISTKNQSRYNLETSFFAIKPVICHFEILKLVYEPFLNISNESPNQSDLKLENEVTFLNVFN